LAASRSDTPALFRATAGTAGTRTETSKGPAASEEASQRPSLFDTLEYREQHPEREQTQSPREEGRSGTGPTRDEGRGKPQGGETPGEPDRGSRAGRPVDRDRSDGGKKPLKRGHDGRKSVTPANVGNRSNPDPRMTPGSPIARGEAAPEGAGDLRS
jgi:hypothetical protein